MKRRDTTKMLSKTDLLKWINDGLPTLQPSCTTIESLGTGAIYCQLINQHHPHTIPDNSIIRQPKNDYEYLSNLRLFQSALGKLKVQKEIDIAKLAKCRYQDNWELASWLYRYFNESTAESTEQYSQTSQSTEKRSHTQTFIQHKENYTNNKGVTIVGKSSVSSELFQSNFVGVIDRAKEILSMPMPDSEKVNQLRMLLNVPMKEDNLSELSDLLGFEREESHGVN